MVVVNAIVSILGTDSFTDYERSVYEKHQQEAEQEIAETLNLLLSSIPLLLVLKQWAAKTACRFYGFREITIRLKSDQKYIVRSPVFLKAKPKKKRGRVPKRHKGALRHLGLELMGIINQVSPALVEVCVSMAVLCPSFEVAAHAWRKPGLKILICVDGGRFRQRRIKRGQRKKGQKRQGFHSDWVEPRLLTISQFDDQGKKIKSISPIIDGSSGSMDDFFELLKQHLLRLNLEDASEIVFSADGGNGIWPGVDHLIHELGTEGAKRVLDYTHAKQNLGIITELICETLKLPDKEMVKLSKQISEQLWNGNINRIADIIREKLSSVKESLKAAFKEAWQVF